MCWCGQQWDGEKMCFPKLDASTGVNADVPKAEPAQQSTLASASDASKNSANS
jgi:hypothetical protein